MFRLPLALLLGAALSALPAAPAGAYDVTTVDGRLVSGSAVCLLGDTPALVTDSGVVEFDAAEIDYPATFKANLGQGGGNIVVFANGAYLRFDGLEMEDGAATIRVANGSTIVVPSELIDFEASVLEAATVRLARGADTTVSRARKGASAPPPPARSFRGQKSMTPTPSSVPRR